MSEVEEMGVRDIIDEEVAKLDESPSSEQPSEETSEVVNTQEEADTSNSDEQEDVSDIPYERFKQVNTENKTLKEDLEKLKEELENSQPQPTEFSEEQLRSMAMERGYTLSKAEQAAQAKDEARLQALLDKVQKPEDREWLKTYAQGIREDVEKGFEDKYGQPLSQFQQIAVEYKLQKSEDQARKLISDMNEKHGLKIDFDKEVDPELAKMIKRSGGQLNAQNTDIFRLTKEYLAEKGVELGKMISTREQQKLNEQKKKAGMEVQSTTSSPKIDDSDSSLRDILEHEAKKQGAEKFFTFG